MKKFIALAALVCTVAQAQYIAPMPSQDEASRAETTLNGYSEKQALNIAVMDTVSCVSVTSGLCRLPDGRSIPFASFVYSKGYTKIYRVEHELGFLRMTVAR